MGTVFNAYEVFEIAEQIERNGGKFYRKAAELAGSEDAREFLLSLAAMEDSHEEFFSSLKKKLKLATDDSLPDLDEQMLAYIKAMAEGKVFGNISDPSESLPSHCTLEALIEKAIQFEKDTIVYFAGIREYVPKAFGKDKIDILIKEEFGHIALLCNKLNE